jgi:transcriptional regulator with XRE-family HTH domain
VQRPRPVASPNFSPIETISDRLGQLLREQGLSAREMSKKCGLAPTTISTLIKTLAKDPLAVELRTLAKIADGTGVSLQWLIFGQGERTQVIDSPLKAARELALIEARSRAYEALELLTQSNSQLAGELIYRLARTGHPQAIEALRALNEPPGFWRLGIELLAELGTENASARREPA